MRSTPTKPRSWPSLAHGDGSWYWDATRHQVELRYMLDGKRTRERGDTPADCLDKREARRTGRDVRVEQLAGLVDDITITQLADKWLPFVSGGKAPGTVMSYEYSRAMIVDRLGTHAVSQVDVDDVEQLLSDFIAEGYSKATLVRIRSHLGMMFRFGVRRRLVKVNPVASIEMPSGAVEPRDAVWLDATEFDAMRAHLSHHPTSVDLVLLTILLTGLRPGEASGLCWDAIDLDAGRIRVETAIQGSRNNRVHKLTPHLKTAGSRRVVEMPGDLIAALRVERKAQAARRLAAPSWKEPRLAFTTATGGIVEASNLRRACRNACTAAGTKMISPNSLRHTNASMLLYRGVSVAEVSRHLGHDDLRMVMTTYGHAMVDVVSTAAVLDKLG